jgi:hypothetical protein
MWRSGVMRRRAHTALLEMIDTAARSGNFVAPWRDTPEIWDHFHDEAEILTHLQRHWRTALAGAIYVAIEAGEGDLRHDVQSAFLKIERKHYALRKVLEAHADHPAIAGAMRKERSLLSAFTEHRTGDAPQAA